MLASSSPYNDLVSMLIARILKDGYIKRRRQSSSSVACSPNPDMRFFSNLSALAILVCMADARPTGNTVLEKVESGPAGWMLDNSAKIDRDGTFITLKIHLVNQEMDKFHKLAMDVRQRYIPQAAVSRAEQVHRSQHRATHSTAIISIMSRY